VADKPLREAFELMVKVFNGRGRVKEEKIKEALGKVEELLKKSRRSDHQLVGSTFDCKKYAQNIVCVRVYSERGFFDDGV